MLAHCVFLNFAKEHSAEARMNVLRDLAALKDQIDGMDGFLFGPNLDFENKSPDHKEGFICLFRDKAALEAYASNPRHQELGGQLVSMCVGGVDGIVVYDLETGG